MSGFNSRCPTFISVHNQSPKPTQPSIPPGSVNDDQLRLERKRQVWFILLADEHVTWGMQVKLRDPLRMRAIPEHINT